jgi:hypothetical protein
MINFDASVGTVMLTTAELAIDKSVTLSAAPQIVTVVRSSQTEFRIFHVMPGHSVENQINPPIRLILPRARA